MTWDYLHNIDLYYNKPIIKKNMIYATSLIENYGTYNNVYLFLKLYLDEPGYSNSEAIMYSDQTIQNKIGAFPLGRYSFDELGLNPLETLHTLTIAKLQPLNPTATFTIVNPIIEPITPTIPE